MKAKSEFVCGRCGLVIYTVGDAQRWKHAAGGGVLGCGKPPLVMKRADYEQRERALVDGAAAALNHMKGD